MYKLQIHIIYKATKVEHLQKKKETNKQKKSSKVRKSWKKVVDNFSLDHFIIEVIFYYFFYPGHFLYFKVYRVSC